MARRIAGLLHPDPEQRKLLLERMLAASRIGAAGTSRSECAGSVGLGGWGWRSDGVARAHGVLVALDGTLYNRDELGTAATDAERIATLYRRHGFAEALRRINGDFAVGLYDPGDDTLWLGRDRFGTKPLYYTNAAGRFAFASRPRALLALPGVRRDVNRRFVALFAGSHYRTFDNEPRESPWSAIAQMPAAHTARIRNGDLTCERYWALEEQPDLHDPEA